MEILDGRVGEVHFSDGEIRVNEWSGWAALRLGQEIATARNESRQPAAADSLGKIWVRMWTIKEAQWEPSPVEVQSTYVNDSVRQFDIRLDQSSSLLQMGGVNIPWRFVSLPGGGTCRVLFTRNVSDDPRADPLKVVVTGFRNEAETLLEFLARDSIRAANSMANFQLIARVLIEGITNDPVSAVAGAYFLLRTDGWKSIPLICFDRLCRDFPWLPDTSLILCVVMTRVGLKTQAEERKAAMLLGQCFDRGLPVYAEAVSLLKEAASVLIHVEGFRNLPSFKEIQILAASQAWTGSTFGFYGAVPWEPSPERLQGNPSRAKAVRTRTKSIQNEAEVHRSIAPPVTKLRDLKARTIAKVIPRTMRR
ncbi:hypothetical protein LNV09_14715 [Paucibacter sp. B2R-40]|uniref:hypothetical protein n=1 Tax=Paucibacter sp. B2R-40 TaxID=2893554 RepID=UPI0021E44FBC|nr:hypothetical protein [Paucibacter sp. B2R-40]MCV2355404.1 hypothetical protein [Paucibacter sp. B2R-40]